MADVGMIPHPSQTRCPEVRPILRPGLTLSSPDNHSLNLLPQIVPRHGRTFLSGKDKLAWVRPGPSFGPASLMAPSCQITGSCHYQCAGAEGEKSVFCIFCSFHKNPSLPIEESYSSDGRCTSIFLKFIIVLNGTIPLGL